MSNARTPGPWELEEVVNDSGNIKHLVPVAYIDGELTSLLTTVEHNGANFATVYDDADARLMVEAPALLKALQDLLAAVNVRIDDPRIALFDAARALVTKVDPDAPLSPAWCASVDAELAATADADAQPVVPELLTDAVVRRGWQHTFSTENPFCPCDLKSFTKAVRWAEMKMLTDLKTQHASDSKELRRLCQERDDLRRANSLHKVNTAALESSVGHLSTLVDELRRLLSSAMQTMIELHGSAAPDESTADIDARIPGAAFAKFVNEHAQLLFEIKNGCAAAPTPTLPAAAVAEGLERDGDALEQAS